MRKLFAMAVGSMLLAGGAAVVRAAPPCSSPAAAVLRISGSVLCITMPDQHTARAAVLDAWIERSAGIVAQYYGRFPARLVDIEIDAVPGADVGSGRTTDEGGLKIRVQVGRDAGPDRLSRDWVLVHEMVHLALPETGRARDWLAEGLAVYVEGVARAQAGNRAVADVWAESRRSMPKGLPQAGEGGLDQTHTWARTYWGGASFCLEADVRMRERTGNRLGLRTALRAILDGTGGYAVQRPIGEVLRMGDEATGTRVLEDLYEQYRAAPRAPDLALLWRRLGVPEDPATEPFDDHAPLAAIRIAITAPSAPRSAH